ncbi:MAG: secretin N-terminal domain-containing protein, partial [Planctomycetota bacterium]
FAVLATLIETLDRPSPEEFTFRVVPLSGAEAGTLIEKAGYVYERLTRGADPQRQPPPAVEFDPLTGNLLITGRTESVRAYEQAVAEARRLLPPARTGKLLALQNARAADVLESLQALLAQTAPVDPARAVPPSLYVVAEPSQHELIARYVRQLDTFEPTELPPLRLIQVRAADAMQISALLRKRYDARPAEQRRERPVEIDADAATNTLVVAAHTEVFDDIKSFVDGVNRSGETRADHETMLFSLKRARAADVAAALDRLYPQPPMPTDRRGRPLPHLREPKPVHVSADAATNTLIIEAPAERRPQFEALVAQLDRVELPPQAQLRTYHIERGDPAQIARTLNDLARQGVMSEPSSDGKPVQVTIQAEPVSRTLIVAGDTLTFEKTEQVLSDLQAVPVPRSLRVFEVTGADPQTLADQATRLYEEQTAEIPGAGEVSVEIDRTHATLLVVADSEAMLRFMSILNELQAAIGPPPEVRLVTLEYADAEEVVRFLSELAKNELALMSRQGGPPPAFHGIEQTNAVLVAARPDQQPVIRSLIGSLDRPQTQTMPPLRILQLRTADAMNLAAALARQYNQRHPEERRDKPVTISADSQTNALIVAAHPAVLPEIEGIVRELNDADRLDYEGREIRIFPLQVARAEELARTIDEMFPQPPVPRDRRGRPLYHLQAPREVVVRADPQTNSLIVDAPILRLAGFENLVEQLDRQKIVDETEVRTYPVVHADLEALASTLRQLAGDGMLSPAGRDRRVPIAVTTEPISRTLVVSGSTDIFERTEQVLHELDVRRAGPSSSLRFFRLTNARAESLVPMLRDVLVRRITEDVEEAGSDPEALISISAERKSNTLIISAPQAIMPVADALVAELDHPRAAVDVLDVRVFTLTQADAAGVAKAVREGVQAQATAEGDEPQITIAAEPSSNSIVVTATPRQVERIEALIASLDGAQPADQPQVRTVFLEHARAENVAPIVEQLLAREELINLNMLPSWARVGYLQMQMQQADPTVRIAADVSLNAVVISAPPALLNMAEQMIAQLDVDPAQVAGAATRSVRVMLVENADAAAIAANIEAFFERGAAADAPPMIRVDAASNSLLVLATDAQLKTIEDVVSQIDQATIAASRQMRMIPIDPGKASAAELARTLKRLLDRGGRGGVEIISVEQLLERRRSAREKPPEAATEPSEASPGPTSALPTGKGSLLQWPGIQLLAVAALAGVPDPEAQPADPTQADPPETADREPGVTIAVDPDTNSLIVVGAPRAIERVADLARQLQDEIPALPGKVRYVGLPTAADARTTANLIGQTLAQMTPPGGRRGDLRRRVAVIADPTNNAVIIACNDLDFEVVGDLIVALTQAPTTEQIVVKVYPLQTITAERAAESVRNLLAPEARRGRRGRQAQRIRDLAVKLLVEDRVIEAVFDPNRVSVSSDPQANALVVMGPPDAVGFVDQFIELIDQTPAQGQTTLKLYAMQHARASDLQGTLRRIFVTRYQSLRGRLGPSTIQPEFSVDDRTNTLLVTASPEQLAEVDTLL